MTTSTGSMRLTGVIPAAGRGTRAYPHTKLIPKGMLDMCGRPLLCYTLEIMRDKLGIVDVVIIIGDKGDIIQDYFGDGSNFGVKITYIFNDKVQLGPVYSVYLSREAVTTDHFVVMLSDELYLDSNHSDIVNHNFNSKKITISVRDNSRWKDICKNFSIQFVGDNVCSLIEKPQELDNDLLGCGTYIFHRDMYNLMKDGFENERDGAGDLTAFINRAIQLGDSVGYFKLTGNYININYQHDVNNARSFIRKRRFPTARISIVLICDAHENEKSISDILSEIPLDYEIILATQKQDELTFDISKQFNARCVFFAENEDGLGQGSLFDFAMKAATGDIVILMMGDGTFEVADIDKILAYICEAELVLGTRTTRQLIEQGANMSLPAHVGNYFLAKLIEMLWLSHKTRITDVGCVFLGIWRDEYLILANGLRSTGGEFLAEMIIECIRRRLQVVEIPVSYCKRIAEKKIRFADRTPKMFFTILSMILSKRILGGACITQK